MLETLQTIGGWMRAIPGPTEHWATIAAAWAWPAAALVIAWWLRGPLGRAAHRLAERFSTDDISLWGLSVSKDDRKIPLDRDEARERSSSFSPEDVEIIEGLYEFAGNTSERAGRLMDWIAANIDPKLHPLDFLSEPAFAPERKAAYIALVGTEHDG